MDRDHPLDIYSEDNDALYEEIAEHGAARRVHDVAACRGFAMSHQEATFNADVESGRTIPGID